MKPDKKREYCNGQLWIGASSWNTQERSIKYAYLGVDRRVSRGSPEVRIKDLIEMICFAAQEGELSEKSKARIISSLGIEK